MAGIELWPWQIVCYCFIFLTGLLGNATVILVILKSGSGRHRFREVPFNIYLMALAIVDLTFSVTCLPIYFLSTSEFDHPKGVNGDILCKLVTAYLIPFWLCDVAIFMLVIISFERHAAICNPFRAVRLGIPRKTYFFIAGAFLASFVIQIPTIVGTRWAGENGTVSYCTYDWPSHAVSTAIYAVVFTCHFVIPAAIFIVNAYRIKKCLATLDGNLRRSLGDAKQGFKIMKSKKKTIRIVFVVTVAFFLLWTPNHVMYMLFQFGDIPKLKWNSNYYQAGMILGFSSSWLNPFLYAFQSSDFRSHCRKVFWKMFGGRFVRRPRDSSQSMSTSVPKSKIGFQVLKPPSNVNEPIRIC